MGRIARGWSLTKASFNVLKLDKEILWLPVLSFLAMALGIAVWVGIALPTIGLPENGMAPLHYVFFFLVYATTAFVATFFLAATIEMATIRLNGGDPVVKDGLSKAWAKKGLLLQWALVSATVGMIIRAIRERSGMLGQVFGTLAEIGWAVATYFAVPILVYKGVGPIDAIKGSTSLVRKTWGEAATGVASTSIIFFLLGLLAIVPIVVGISLGGVGFVVGLAIAAIYLALVGAADSAVRGILVAALYKFAEDGQMPSGFEAAQPGY